MECESPPVPVTVNSRSSRALRRARLFSSSDSTSLGLKLAVTALAASSVTGVEAVPLQAPPYPVKPEPPEAMAASVTVLPAGYSCEQSDPQVMPEGCGSGAGPVFKNTFHRLPGPCEAGAHPTFRLRPARKAVLQTGAKSILLAGSPFY